MSKMSLNPDSLFPSRQYGFSQIVVAQGNRTTTWIGVQSLARPEFLIEIEGTAVLD